MRSFFRITLYFIIAAIAAIILFGFNRYDSHKIESIESVLYDSLPLLFEPKIWGDLVPNSDVTADINQTQERRLKNAFKYSYHINSLGFRGGEQEISGGTWKLLLLGDGNGFGTGLNGSQDIASQLFLALKKNHPDCPAAVLNGAMPGYTLTDELDYVRDKGGAIKPHIVIVIMSPDDVWEIERPVIIRKERKGDTNSITDIISEWRRKKYKLFTFKEYYLEKSRLSEDEALKKVIPRYMKLAFTFRNEVAKHKGRTLFVLWESPELKVLEPAMRDSGLDYIYIALPRHIPDLFLIDGHWSAGMSKFVAGKISEWIDENEI